LAKRGIWKMNFGAVEGGGCSDSEALREVGLQGMMRRLVEDPEAWYAALYDTPLRPYQLEVAKGFESLIDDCRSGRCGPETGLAIMSRQAGKNETSARLEVRLLAKYARLGGQIVKGAPTARPQLVMSKRRLKRALKTPLTTGAWSAEEGYIFHLGEASIVFLSGEPQAQRHGETADIALIMDEFQLIDGEVFNRDFKPMTMSTGAPTLAWGTVWNLDTLLEQTREFLRERQKKVGRKLLFEVPWWVVAESVPRYGQAVEAEIARLGLDHPIIQTQYCLRALQSSGRFFEPRHLESMRGDFPRRHGPQAGKVYVAGVDLAGSDEEDPVSRFQMARDRERDSIVVTIAELSWTRDRLPVLRVVDFLYLPGLHPDACRQELMNYLFAVWRVVSVTVDARGVGDALASLLKRARPQSVTALRSTIEDVSKIAFSLLGAAGTGRLKVFQDDGSEESRQFWFQCGELRRELTPGGKIRFKAPDRKQLVAGSSETVHDDFPKSLGYTVHAAQDHLYSYHEGAFFDSQPAEQWQDEEHGYW